MPIGKSLRAIPGYYRTPSEGGFFPRDRPLGQERTSLSPATARMVGTAAACVSFTRAFDLIDDLASLGISPKLVE